MSELLSDALNHWTQVVSRLDTTATVTGTASGTGTGTGQQSVQCPLAASISQQLPRTIWALARLSNGLWVVTCHGKATHSLKGALSVSLNSLISPSSYLFEPANEAREEKHQHQHEEQQPEAAVWVSFQLEIWIITQNEKSHQHGAGSCNCAACSVSAPLNFSPARAVNRVKWMRLINTCGLTAYPRPGLAWPGL